MSAPAVVSRMYRFEDPNSKVQGFYDLIFSKPYLLLFSVSLSLCCLPAAIPFCLPSLSLTPAPSPASVLSLSSFPTFPGSHFPLPLTANPTLRLCLCLDKGSREAGRPQVGRGQHPSRLPLRSFLGASLGWSGSLEQDVNWTFQTPGTFRIPQAWPFICLETPGEKPSIGLPSGCVFRLNSLGFLDGG